MDGGWWMVDGGWYNLPPGIRFKPKLNESSFLQFFEVAMLENPYVGKPIVVCVCVCVCVC